MIKEKIKNKKKHDKGFLSIILISSQNKLWKVVKAKHCRIKLKTLVLNKTLLKPFSISRNTFQINIRSLSVSV
jgi:hypothetical protein